MRRKYLKADLARDLDLSRASITQLSKRGMPVHSVEAAREWRRIHLDPSWTKPEPETAATGPARTRAEDGAPWSPPMVAACLADIQYYADAATGDFAGWKTPLRVAMQALPRAHWNEVELPASLWEELIGAPFLEVVEKAQRELSPDEAVAPIPAEHAFVCDNWVYLLASGLLKPSLPAAQDA